MAQPPRESRFDSTLALLRDPYRYIARRCRAHGSDVFAGRVLLQRTLFMSGAEAAAVFYDTEHFARRGAAPGRLQKTLFGRGGVQGLDDAEHRHRKQMFLSLMTPARIRRLIDGTHAVWERELARQERSGPFALYGELKRILTRSACDWVGLPLPDAELDARTQQLSALFEAAGSVGPRHWAARRHRRQAETWIAALVDEARSGADRIVPGSPAAHVISHRDLEGEPLSPHIAAVEILNLVRPIIAVSVYMTFVAHALHTHPQLRREFTVDAPETEAFAQEVRRHYPFFPAVIARVRRDFEWHGYSFPAGRQVLLDLHGTNHDPRVWQEPDEFRPARFDGRRADSGARGSTPGNADVVPPGISEYALVPQGGGDHARDHRCPGEWITLDLMKLALVFLTTRLRYVVPDLQDLELDLARLPALPRSGFVIDLVKASERP